jgi:hypothetical protein
MVVLAIDVKRAAAGVPSTHSTSMLSPAAQRWYPRHQRCECVCVRVWGGGAWCVGGVDPAWCMLSAFNPSRNVRADDIHEHDPARVLAGTEY